MPSKKDKIRVCSFINCDSTSNEIGLRFFGFPKVVERCKAWIKAAKNPSISNMRPGFLHNKYICAKHFSNSDYSYIFDSFHQGAFAPLRKTSIPKEISDVQTYTVIDNIDDKVLKSSIFKKPTKIKEVDYYYFHL